MHKLLCLLKCHLHSRAISDLLFRNAILPSPPAFSITNLYCVFLHSTFYILLILYISFVVCSPHQNVNFTKGSLIFPTVSLTLRKTPDHSKHASVCWMEVYWIIGSMNLNIFKVNMIGSFSFSFFFLKGLFTKRRGLAQTCLLI